MDRRGFLAAAASVALAGGVELRTGRARAGTAAAQKSELPAPWRCFEITTRVTLLDAPGHAQLWLPLAQTSGGYQTALDLSVQSSGHATVMHDARYGADLLRATWDDEPDAPGGKRVDVVQRVATRDRHGADRVVPVTEAERQFWMQPTDSLPTSGIVHDTAARIVAGQADPRMRLRAIYDWVVEQTSRDPSTPGCGLGDIRTMLETGRLAGKCADINSLMTGLARAAGFPARDVYGIRVAPSRQDPSLGVAGLASKAQHCRSEIYLEDAGWFPVDPADVRKVMLERKLPLDSPEIRALRERLFGGWEMNWVGYNSATDIVLPGAAPGQQPNFPFLMYPCAFTRAGQPNCLEPDRFRYEITTREITA